MNSETANLNPFNEANMYPDNTKISGHGMVKKYDVRVGKTGNKYVDIILADKTGDVNAKFFNYVDGTSELFHAGDLVGYSGIVRRFNGAFQVTLDDVWRAPATVKPEDFVKSADYPSEDMYAKIITMIGTFKDAELRDLTLSIYEKYQEKLMYFPAAVKMHHAMRGGLLFHTLSIMTLAEKMVESAMRHIKILEDLDYDQMKISLKSNCDVLSLLIAIEKYKYISIALLISHTKSTSASVPSSSALRSTTRYL